MVVGTKVNVAELARKYLQEDESFRPIEIRKMIQKDYGFSPSTESITSARRGYFKSIGKKLPFIPWKDRNKPPRMDLPSMSNNRSSNGHSHQEEEAFAETETQMSEETIRISDLKAFREMVDRIGGVKVAQFLLEMMEN